MTELGERKRLLRLQADLHRALLRAEAANVRAHWCWLKDVRATVRSASPWWAVGAAVLGLVAAWRGRTLARWLPVALAFWRRAR